MDRDAHACPKFRVVGGVCPDHGSSVGQPASSSRKVGRSRGKINRSGSAAHQHQQPMRGATCFAHGFSQANSKKGEDAWCVVSPQSGGQPGAWAIFDGHGGREFAHVIAYDTTGGVDHGPDHYMLPKLLAAGSGGLPSEKDFEDIFWQSDEDLGKMLASLDRPRHNGCTAQILVAKASADGGVECIQAWVGDSTAVRVDMKGGQVVDATFNHNPGEGNESAVLEHMAAVSKACRKRLKRDSNQGGEDEEEEGEARVDSAREQVPSVELIKEVLHEMKHPDTSEAHIAFLHKVFKREKLILRYLPSGGKYRRSCFIYTRPFRKDENEPLTVHTTRDPFASHHADMMMTRSLGDWRHVAWILPRPQVEPIRAYAWTCACSMRAYARRVGPTEFAYGHGGCMHMEVACIWRWHAC